MKILCFPSQCTELAFQGHKNLSSPTRNCNPGCCIIIHLPCTETSPACCFRKTWRLFQHTGKQETVKCQLYGRGTLPVPPTVVEKYMAQSLHIGLSGPFTNLPFGICAIYFDLKVHFWNLLGPAIRHSNLLPRHHVNMRLKLQCSYITRLFDIA